VSKDSRPTSASSAPEKSAALRDRLLWICPLAGLLAAAAILWLFGFALWTVLAFLFLIACPLAVVWVLAIERRLGPLSWRRE
jgi:hypothetical protein